MLLLYTKFAIVILIHITLYLSVTALRKHSILAWSKYLSHPYCLFYCDIVRTTVFVIIKWWICVGRFYLSICSILWSGEWLKITWCISWPNAMVMSFFVVEIVFKRKYLCSSHWLVFEHHQHLSLRFLYLKCSALVKL